MAKYRECPYCGCNLDPGERCDCMEVKREKEKKLRQRQAEATRLAEQEGMWQQQVLAI